MFIRKLQKYNKSNKTRLKSELVAENF